MLWRLWLHHMLKLKSVSQKCFQIGRQRPMVLNHLFTQKGCCALSLQVVVVNGEVKDVSLVVIVPILGPIGGKYWVLHRKDKLAFWFQPTADILNQRRKI